MVKTLIKYLDENKIILGRQQIDAIRHLNIDKLFDSQRKIIDDRIEEIDNLIEVLESCSMEDCSCENHDKIIEAMEACSMTDCLFTSYGIVLTNKKPNN